MPPYGIDFAPSPSLELVQAAILSPLGQSKSSIHLTLCSQPTLVDETSVSLLLRPEG